MTWRPRARASRTRYLRCTGRQGQQMGQGQVGARRPSRAACTARHGAARRGRRRRHMPPSANPTAAALAPPRPAPVHLNCGMSSGAPPVMSTVLQVSLLAAIQLHAPLRHLRAHHLRAPCGGGRGMAGAGARDALQAQQRRRPRVRQYEAPCGRQLYSALWRRLHVAVPARLVAEQADVELQDGCGAPHQRRHHPPPRAPLQTGAPPGAPASGAAAPPPPGVSAACSQHGSGGRCRYAAAAPGGRVHLRPEGAWPCLAARSPTPPHTQPTAHPMPTWPTSATRACSCCSSPSDSSSSRVAGMSEGNASSAAAAAPRPAPAAAVRACRRLRTGQRGEFTHSVSASMMQWPAGKAGGSDRGQEALAHLGAAAGGTAASCRCGATAAPGGMPPRLQVRRDPAVIVQGAQGALLAVASMEGCSVVVGVRGAAIWARPRSL